MEPTSEDFGVSIRVDAKALTATESQELRDLVYRHRLVILKNQDLDPGEFLEFGRKLGRVHTYYESMYHHPEHPEIFVSSNRYEGDKTVGVPKTGKFWHSDYGFMPEPFALTVTYPRAVPKENRGTFFIDMAKGYSRLEERLKQLVSDTSCEHTARKYFKIRPQDVYKPIGMVLQEVDETTPPVWHPTVVKHPVTGEDILYVSEGFTQAIRGLPADADNSAVLEELLAASGQLDDSFCHPNIEFLDIELGDVMIWDNRRFIHRAKHASTDEVTETYRLTLYDDFDFCAGHS